MKSAVKILRIIGVVSCGLVLASCGKSETHNHEAEHEHVTEDNQEHIYACPMHPEETGHEGDKCAKCGMALELVNKQSSDNPYFIEFSANPAVEAGKSATLSFTPKTKRNESEAVALDVQHEKKLHLIIVSKDLSYFDHVHPEYQASGSYDITVLPQGKDYSTTAFRNETKFEKGGDYILFADYVPNGSTHQLDRFEINVAGTPYEPKKFTAPKTVSTADGYEVSLVPNGGKFVSKGTMHIAGIIKKDGKEIAADQLENYLGAKAHVVMISENTKDYLHVHPEVIAGRLDLQTEFGKPGIFRGWLQFQKGGTVHTADFVLNVEEGTAEQNEEKAAGHDHAH
jgi:hypothetical protein